MILDVLQGNSPSAALCSAPALLELCGSGTRELSVCCWSAWRGLGSKVGKWLSALLLALPKRFGAVLLTSLWENHKKEYQWPLQSCQAECGWLRHWEEIAWSRGKKWHKICLLQAPNLAVGTQWVFLQWVFLAFTLSPPLRCYFYSPAVCLPASHSLVSPLSTGTTPATGATGYGSNRTILCQNHLLGLG